MHGKAQTLSRGGQLTTSLTVGGIDIRGETWPRTSLWGVEVRIIGASTVHSWHGWAATASDAKTRAMTDAGQAWPGFGRCVISCREV